jgi:bis(5'-nucleosyl)-tetraphosphatase (symmetrical)
MATYVVGDIQGCFKPLQCLLEQAHFDWDHDKLWAAGDLVNRGPDSLEVLRFLYQHRERVVCVLGNHDLHLLAVANGQQKQARTDTLDNLLSASDCDELLDWLRHQPLIYSDRGYTLVHAGIPHIWSLEEAHAYAAEVETALRGAEYRDFLGHMYGNKPKLWENSLQGYERLRLITNYLTRMRFIYSDGTLDLKRKGGNPDPERKVEPWFKLRDTSANQQKLFFGHWAALEGHAEGENLFATDTGCVWGRELSMYCLETEEWHRCDCE